MRENFDDVSTHLVGDTLLVQTVHGTYSAMRHICSTSRTWGLTILKPISLFATVIAAIPVRAFVNSDQPTAAGGLAAIVSVLACAAFIHHQHGKQLGREMASLLRLDAEQYATLIKAIIEGVREGNIAPTRHAPNVVTADARKGPHRVEFTFKTQPHP